MLGFMTKKSKNDSSLLSYYSANYLWGDFSTIYSALWKMRHTIDIIPESPIPDWPKNIRKVARSYETIILDGLKNPFYYTDGLAYSYLHHKSELKNIIIDGKGATPKYDASGKAINKFFIDSSIEQLTVMNFTQPTTIQFVVDENGCANLLNTLNILNCTDVTLQNHINDLVGEIELEAKLSHLHTFRLIKSTVRIERLFHRLMPELRNFITHKSTLYMSDRRTVEGALPKGSFSVRSGEIYVYRLTMPLSIEYVQLDPEGGNFSSIITHKGRDKLIEFPKLTYYSEMRDNMHIASDRLPHRFSVVLVRCLEDNFEAYGKRLSRVDDLDHTNYLSRILDSVLRKGKTSMTLI